MKRNVSRSIETQLVANRRGAVNFFFQWKIDKLRLARKIHKKLLLILVCQLGLHNTLLVLRKFANLVPQSSYKNDTPSFGPRPIGFLMDFSYSTTHHASVVPVKAASSCDSIHLMVLRTRTVIRFVRTNRIDAVRLRHRAAATIEA